MAVQLNAEIIEGFAGAILSQKFDRPTKTPEFHKEMWKICTSRYKKIAIAAPRGHAKTTGVTTAYGLATLLFRERRFMILVSDTESQASMFLGYFKEQLQNNEALAESFQLFRNEKGLVEFETDTQTDIIVKFKDGHRFRVIAKGAEQKLRGMLWDGIRPDIILCDDMENDELVLNKDRREKMRQWFYSALLPCLSVGGIIRVVGTIMHMDSLLERLMPNPYSKFSKQGPLKLWSTVMSNTGWFSIKYRAHDADFEHILWEEKNPKSVLKTLQAEYTAMGMPDKYSQEYLNVPIDESVAYFKRMDFIARNDEDKAKRLNYYVTVDLAISEEERADYSVFLVAGVDEERKIHVVQVVRERLDGREIVDTLIELQRIYKPEFIGIEEMQVSKSIGPFLNEEMFKTGVFINTFKLKHGGKDKMARGRSMQARMRAKGVRFDKSGDWYPQFEDELCRFPRDVHDDQFDAFAYLGLLLNSIAEAATDEEVEEEEYERELEDSGINLHGRNRTTGY